MSIKTKFAILAASILITFIGFNLIASPTLVEMMKVGKKAGYEIIANVLAKEAAQANSVSFKG